MHNLFSTESIDKAVLSIVAWFVYIVLLWGRTMKAGGVGGSCGLTCVAGAGKLRRWPILVAAYYSEFVS